MFLPCFQLSFTCGILSIAKSSSTILWNHFVKKSEQSEENTNNQSAGIDACISLQRFLHFSFILALHSTLLTGKYFATVSCSYCILASACLWLVLYDQETRLSTLSELLKNFI